MYLSSRLLSGTLSYGVALASSQAFPTITTSTYSYQETSEATIPPSYLEYNITYPVHEFQEIMDTSYKDTTDVSWTVAAPDHLPILQIECWFRNRSVCKFISWQ